MFLWMEFIATRLWCPAPTRLNPSPTPPRPSSRAAFRRNQYGTNPISSQPLMCKSITLEGPWTVCYLSFMGISCTLYPRSAGTVALGQCDTSHDHSITSQRNHSRPGFSPGFWACYVWLLWKLSRLWCAPWHWSKRWYSLISDWIAFGLTFHQHLFLFPNSQTPCCGRFHPLQPCMDDRHGALHFEYSTSLPGFSLWVSTLKILCINTRIWPLFLHAPPFPGSRLHSWP